MAKRKQHHAGSSPAKKQRGGGGPAAAGGQAAATPVQPQQQQQQQLVAQKQHGVPSPAAGQQQQQQQGGSKGFKNKEKVLVLGTRGITYRSRHLMTDFISLLPHSKKDVKLDTKSDRGVINEVADEKGCSSVLFFEARKRQDLYLWMAKAPDGPTAKFLVLNVHTMDELKLTGNHLRGSRPVLSFDASFDEQPHLQLLKEVLGQVFGTPARHHKAKPFFDHVFSFSVADGCIWMRNYQVVMPLDKKKVEPSNATLVEVGPRCALRPIKIFEGSFGGRVLYDNPEFVSPNVVRRLMKQQKAGKYVAKVNQKAKRRVHEEDNVLPVSEVDEVFKL